MFELTIIIDTLNGGVLLEDPGRLAPEILDEVNKYLGAGQELGCALPLNILQPPRLPPEGTEGSTCVRVAGYYHNSLIEGPGRRSSVLFQSCPLACKGCWVPNLHDPNSGILVPADMMAEVLLDPAYERDGVSILGGEPFAQPNALLALIMSLRARGCSHILCYTGYTYEALRGRERFQPEITAILNEVDILIDGPYIESLSGSAGPWTGSGNQRVIDLRDTLRRGAISLYLG